jgi:uncharacterized protein
MTRISSSFFSHFLRWQLLVFALIAAASSVVAQKAVPELWGFRVHDEAHVLKQETIDRLERLLADYEDSTTNQIAILTVTSLQGEVLEQYSLRVAETWKLGTAQNDNGVLLLVAVDDRAMRIEVGHGLEGVLTDAQCNRIIRNEMAPAFRRGDYDAGISAGIAGIVAAIGGEYTAADASGATIEMNWGAVVVVSLFVFGILGLFTAIGLFSKGGIAWVLYVFLALFYGTFPIALYGNTGGLAVFITYLIAYPITKVYLNRHPKWKKKMTEWHAAGNGRWSTGGSGSSGGSSGGSSFSGGGGSFGGGGSSGRW